MGLKRTIRIRIIDKLPRRYRFFIERSYMKLHHSGGHLRGDLAVMKRLCKPDTAVLDIGASSGAITLYLCKFARHVYSFEPNPTAADQLRQKFAGCNVTVENIALGNVEADLTLSIPYVGDKKMEAWSSIIKDFRNEIILGAKVTRVERIKTKVRRLDSFNIMNIGFIKIDVEGFELDVLRGAENTIKREMPNLFIEIEKRHHKQGDVHEVFHCLKNWGYSACFVNGKELQSIEDFDFEKMQNEEFENTPKYINDFVFKPVHSYRGAK